MVNKNSAAMAILFVAIIGLYFPAQANVIEIPADYTTIQAGIDASSDGDTVLVWPDTYIENINFNNHQVVLGSRFFITGDTTLISTTILDGNFANSVIRNDNWHDSLSEITGFTIINGDAPYGGGGIVYHGSGKITNNIIMGNRATRGGGIYLEGDALIENNIITENHVTVAGAGIITYGGACVIRNNQIINNISTYYGGGVHFEDSQIITLENNTIAYNQAASNGGGVLFYADVAGGVMINNLIVGNTCDRNSALGLYGGTYNFTNNTFADNSHNSNGVHVFDFCEVTLINNIFWNNADTEIVIEPNAQVSITYCDIQGGIAGESNIDSDPLFCDPENGDYQLAENSPCAGTGYEGANMGAFGIGCDASGITDNDNALPIAIHLSQNYPNPFNGSTTISFSLASPQLVRLSIYDLLGRKLQTLVDSYLPAGKNQVIFDASAFPSGVFFYNLKAGDYSQTKKMILLK